MIPLTKNRFKFFEATSTFQKAIRRGDEPTALYFAVEFFNSGLEDYLWKRIRIITSEDIGLAAPSMPVIIQSLFQMFTDVEKEKSKNRPERMFLIHAVLLLCRAKKSRLVDYELVALWREHDTIKMLIPDYAYDMHNYKGKQMGRGIDHFYDEGTQLENYSAQAGEEKSKKRAKEWHQKFPKKLQFETNKKGNRSHQQTIFNDDAIEE